MSLERYTKNPFLENFSLSVKGRKVTVSQLGKKNEVFINQKTGEVLNGTHLMSYKKVDTSQFVKIFTDNISLMFDLKTCGTKALTVLIWAVQQSAVTKDQVMLDNIVLQNFLQNQDKITLSSSVFYRGLKELCEAKIIARTMRHGCYYINPNFIFNGDRIAFTNIVECGK